LPHFIKPVQKSQLKIKIKVAMSHSSWKMDRL